MQSSTAEISIEVINDHLVEIKIVHGIAYAWASETAVIQVPDDARALVHIKKQSMFLDAPDSFFYAEHLMRLAQLVKRINQSDCLNTVENLLLLLCPTTKTAVAH